MQTLKEMERVNILYISSVDVSGTSGPSANEREFIPQLHKLIGDRAHFILPHPALALPSDIPSEACTFIAPFSGANPFRWAAHQWSIARAARRILHERSFDLIVSRVKAMDVGLFYVTRRSNVPYALKTLGVSSENLFRKRSYAFSILKPVSMYIYRALVRKSILSDVVSLAQVRMVADITGSEGNVVWVDNGVNTDRFRPIATSEARQKLGLGENFTHLVGYCGNFPWERGAMQIVEALPALSARIPGVGALIVGAGEHMHLLHDRALQLGVHGRCIFTGRVEYEKVPLYISAMDIAVSMRQEDTQHASELKVRQYLACGKPVVVTPGSNDFVADEQIGFVVGADDSERFTDACAQILSLATTDYEAMSGRAVRYAEKTLSYRAKVEERLSLWSQALKAAST